MTKELRGDPIPRLARAYGEVLHEYGALLQIPPDKVTPDVRAKRAELMKRLAELNGRLEALRLDES
jgi:hypothetical protein